MKFSGIPEKNAVVMAPINFGCFGSTPRFSGWRWNLADKGYDPIKKFTSFFGSSTSDLAQTEHIGNTS